jgi:hypothetical protein
MNKTALRLPDQLLVRYYREGEIDSIQSVKKTRDRIRVQLTIPDQEPRVDQWRDLGGGLGFVPDLDT